jgi:8-oxo-dGTP pyrophosphatase MutT (NUDIX family)
MGVPKIGKSKNGKPMHYSVGAVIKRKNKYLLIDRKIPPFGFAGLAGHIDEGENEIEALFREIEEESGLKIKKYKLLFEEEIDWNWCNYGIGSHYWYLFECEVAGKLKPNYAEMKSISWYSPEEIKKLKLEPVWEYWFKKLKVI